MARRQLQIKGTERTDVPEAVLEASEKFLELRRAKRKAADKAKEGLHGVIALMQAHKVPELKVMDPDTEEYLTLRIDLDPKLRIKKSGEMEPEPIGNGVASGGSDEPAVHPGLIAQVEKEMAENGVAENDEGDVVTPDKAAPKQKKAKKKGKGK